MAKAGVPVNPMLFSLLARVTRQGARIKAGSYELKPGTTPRRLLDQLVRGEFAQEALTIIEGWTFRQMRQAIAASKGLQARDRRAVRHRTDGQDLDRLQGSPKACSSRTPICSPRARATCRSTSRRTTMLMTHLNAAWEKRDPSLPYTTPYEALIMASIVEKETGQKSERAMIAGVFVNRLQASACCCRPTRP